MFRIFDFSKCTHEHTLPSETTKATLTVGNVCLSAYLFVYLLTVISLHNFTLPLCDILLHFLCTCSRVVSCCSCMCHYIGRNGLQQHTYVHM